MADKSGKGGKDAGTGTVSVPLTMTPEREAQMRAWDTDGELWREIDALRKVGQRSTPSSGNQSVSREECEALLALSDKALNNLHGESTPEGSIVCDENGIVVFYCPMGHINDAKFAIAARADMPRLARAHIALLVENANLKRDKERQWQPIETAPKGGWFLLSIGWRGVTVGRRSLDPDYEWEFLDISCPHKLNATDEGVTHWMPLPEPAAAMQGKSAALDSGSSTKEIK